MASKGYATVAQVQAWYGATLSVSQTAQVTGWMESAERIIDQATDSAWLTGAITAERHWVNGPIVPLHSAPLQSVTAVRGYHRGSSTGTTLTSGTDYELDSLTSGRLWLAVWEAYDTVQVDYLPATPVPTEISEATAALLAFWLANGHVGGATGAVVAKKFDVASIQYAAPETPAALADLPQPVQQLLRRWLPAVVLA